MVEGKSLVLSYFQKKNSGPPTAALFNKVKITPLGKKKDNKNHSSRFRISQDRELQKLPPLKGTSWPLFLVPQ